MRSSFMFFATSAKNSAGNLEAGSARPASAVKLAVEGSAGIRSKLTAKRSRRLCTKMEEIRFVVAAAIGLIAAAHLHGQSPSPQGHPPPGRLVDIGDRKLHLNCAGRGSPTVI